MDRKQGEVQEILCACELLNMFKKKFNHMSTTTPALQIMHSFVYPTFPGSKELAWKTHTMSHICFQAFSRNLVSNSTRN